MTRHVPDPATKSVQLRDVIGSDLPILVEHQLDPAANYMAAFTARDPIDRDAFMAHWTRILSDETITVQTILFNGQVAGSVASYKDEEFGELEVTYWIGRITGARALQPGRSQRFWIVYRLVLSMAVLPKII